MIRFILSHKKLAHLLVYVVEDWKKRHMFDKRPLSYGSSNDTSMLFDKLDTNIPANN